MLLEREREEMDNRDKMQRTFVGMKGRATVCPRFPGQAPASPSFRITMRRLHVPIDPPSLPPPLPMEEAKSF